MDNIYMEVALKQAKKAGIKGDIPVGAIIVKNNKIIAKAYNKRERTNDATCHAEVVVIRKACRVLKDWRLNECKLYVTLQPCIMCAGAAIQARVDQIIYATKSDSNDTDNLKIEMCQIDNLAIQKESSELLKKFFQNKRK